MQKNNEQDFDKKPSTKKFVSLGRDLPTQEFMTRLPCCEVVFITSLLCFFSTLKILRLLLGHWRCKAGYITLVPKKTQVTPPT